MSFIGSKQIRKCKKDHACDYCQGKIQTGSSYMKNVFYESGVMVTFKECETCTEFLSKKENYDEVYGENGEAYLTSFMESEKYREFIKARRE